MGIISEIRESTFLLAANLLPRLKLSDRIRFLFVKWAGVNIEGRCTIWSGFDIRPIGHASHLTISKRVFINRNFRCAMPKEAEVTIGEGATIGPNVMIETASHGIAPDRRNEITANSVVIGKNVWIGARVTILGGVTIGDNSVIAAGAVVKDDVKPNTIVAGIPAIEKKEIGWS